jgi:hypothetical protein
MVAALSNLRAESEAGSNHSHQAELEAAAAEFDRRMAQRIAARLASMGQPANDKG